MARTADTRTVSGRLVKRPAKSLFRPSATTTTKTEVTIFFAPTILPKYAEKSLARATVEEKEGVAVIYGDSGTDGGEDHIESKRESC